MAVGACEPLAFLPSINTLQGTSSVERIDPHHGMMRSGGSSKRLVVAVMQIGDHSHLRSSHNRECQLAGSDRPRLGEVQRVLEQNTDADTRSAVTNEASL